MRNGKENVHKLHDELADVMIANATVNRDNRTLSQTLDKIAEIKERYKSISLDDRGEMLNQTYTFANQFHAMLALAGVIVKSALERNESRGSHFKAEYPERNDKEWLKTTIATYNPKIDACDISYVPVSLNYIEPTARDYTKAKKVKPTFKNLPSQIQSPI